MTEFPLSENLSSRLIEIVLMCHIQSDIVLPIMKSL